MNAMQTGKLIVIGGGIAGITAAQAVRDEYPHVEITLFSKEPYPFYNKIALNSFITGKRSRAEMNFFSLNWLSQQRINDRWGEWIVSIDKLKHTAISNLGKQYSYDKLILATGATPNTPIVSENDADQISNLWTMEDALRVKDSLGATRSVAIIGGGILGIETAVDLADTGISVTIIEARNSLLPQHLNTASSKLFEGFIREKGVQIKLGARGFTIGRDNRGAQILRKDGKTIQADLILTMAGVRPNTKLAAETDLKINNGIWVDKHMLTSDPDILACGNCVELYGRTEALWNPAISQASVAGVNAFQTKIAASSQGSSIHLKLSQMPLFICGDPLDQNPGDRESVTSSDKTYRNIRTDKDGLIRSAILLGDTRGFYQIEHAFKVKTKIDTGLIDNYNAEAIIADLQARDHREEDEAWVCKMCGYTYEGEEPPDLCPVCAVGKDQFLVA